MKYTGIHLLIEFWGGKVPQNSNDLEKILTQAAIESNSQPLCSTFHKFDPHGITGVIVLAESHIAIHDWPELGYTSLDISTCGKKSLPYKALLYLSEKFKPKRVEVREIKRGRMHAATQTNNVQTTEELQIEEEKVFGQELTLDLYDCNPELIRSKEKILEYSDKLCNIIKMKKYGKPFIERFAEHSEFAAGYSLAQLIETSLISGHFSELWNRAYINIFSCKSFDAQGAIKFTKEFFQAESVKSQFSNR